ncbi:MAG TPA: spore germination protein GerW family protein [Candidatus Aminicenantes bacterium]|nr:spore germination protein GerW family protein [Candidatus Aminicenantes bacterium]HPB56606.1 spore germination protein GerW family protein [Candidatus Aminicenantes bacterium]HPS99044.1 spore germination protein GerW family protein [Candidatus Aminicenantes bacterium]
MDVKEIIQESAISLHKNTGAKAVFGEPYEKEGLTVIPVARVSLRGGGGGGAGSDEQPDTQGLGMGLGLSMQSVPVGYIEINEGKTTFREIKDTTRVALAGAALAAFGLWSVTRVFVRLLKKR